MTNLYSLAQVAPAALQGTRLGHAAIALSVAALLGAVIGMEREHHGRSAGLRTHLLVSLGSALVMLVSLHFAHRFGGSSLAGISIDPARVAYGVMGGIGFIGAGTIMQYGAGVRGLTTAASLWCSAAVGLACGFAMFGIAVVATLLVLLTLTLLSKLERHIPSRQTKTIVLSLPLGQQDYVPRIRSLLGDMGARVVDMECSRDIRRRAEELTFHVSLSGKTDPAQLRRLQEEVPEISRLIVR